MSSSLADMCIDRPQRELPDKGKEKNSEQKKAPSFVLNPQQRSASCPKFIVISCLSVGLSAWSSPRDVFMGNDEKSDKITEVAD